MRGRQSLKNEREIGCLKGSPSCSLRPTATFKESAGKRHARYQAMDAFDLRLTLLQVRFGSVAMHITSQPVSVWFSMKGHMTKGIRYIFSKLLGRS